VHTKEYFEGELEKIKAAREEAASLKRSAAVISSTGGDHPP
jgi:hypothetical protein